MECNGFVFCNSLKDLKEPHAVLAVMIYFSKAFNRQDHNILLTLLCNLGVPGWLLNIVASFLQNRELILSYQGCTAKSRKLPGGGPQGTVLGMFLFIVLINLVGFENQNKQVGKTITKSLNRRKPMETIHLKFIDDLSVAESLNLKKQLIKNPDVNQPRPLDFHDRTEHILPESESRVQELLNTIVDYTDTHKMKVNGEKSKVMLFNSSKKYDFMPKLSMEPRTNLTVVESCKLLGVVLQSNLKWNENTDYICSKAYDRIWMIRRLKLLGATNEELIDVYNKQVRSVLEMAVAVWSPAITLCQVAQLERVQKTVCAVILGGYHTDYAQAISVLGMTTLRERRTELCSKFAKKCFKNEKFENWFVPRITDPATIQTRSDKPALVPVNTRTKRYKKSPLPYLTALLNDTVQKK